MKSLEHQAKARLPQGGGLYAQEQQNPTPGFQLGRLVWAAAGGGGLQGDQRGAMTPWKVVMAWMGAQGPPRRKQWPMLPSSLGHFIISFLLSRL